MVQAGLRDPRNKIQHKEGDRLFQYVLMYTKESLYKYKFYSKTFYLYAESQNSHIYRL